MGGATAMYVQAVVCINAEHKPFILLSEGVPACLYCNTFIHMHTISQPLIPGFNTCRLTKGVRQRGDWSLKPSDF